MDEPPVSSLYSNQFMIHKATVGLKGWQKFNSAINALNYFDF